MPIDALWGTVFADAQKKPHSSGVILLKNGHLHGGDNNYHYEGKYRLEGEEIHLTLTATHFHGGRNHIAGSRDAFTLHASGPKDGDRLELCGEVDDDPEVKVTLQMQRVGELPEAGPSLV
ncbi:MAG TPA: GrlR family regulatory protein [Gammaproteobacteria bacterium]|nr:GrlR family regulatory protein [Gammaproteobacteria bacterium]